MDDPAWYEAATEVAGIRFDRVAGLGRIPTGEDIEHFGMTVLMRPSAYLMLASRLTFPRTGTHDHIGNLIRRGEPLAPAYLQVEWPERPGNLPCVVSHEGRHRMGAIRDTKGNVPVPVHLCVQFRRHDFLTDDRVSLLRNSMFHQDRLLAIHGPMFSHARVARRTIEGPATPTFNAFAGHVPFEPNRATQEFLAESVRREGTALTFGRARDLLAALDQDGLEGYGEWFYEEAPRRGRLLVELESLVRAQGAGTEVTALLGPVEEAPPFRP